MGVPGKARLPTYNPPQRQSIIQQAHTAQVYTSAMYSSPEMHVMGKPMWMWLLWAGYVGYTPSTNTTEIATLVAELDALTAEKSDEWAAFVTAQRIQGRKIWDTEAT